MISSVIFGGGRNSALPQTADCSCICDPHCSVFLRILFSSFSFNPLFPLLCLKVPKEVPKFMTRRLVHILSHPWDRQQRTRLAGPHGDGWLRPLRLSKSCWPYPSHVFLIEQLDDRGVSLGAGSLLAPWSVVRRVGPHTTTVMQGRSQLHRNGLPFVPRHRTQPPLPPPPCGASAINIHHVDSWSFPQTKTRVSGHAWCETLFLLLLFFFSCSWLQHNNQNEVSPSRQVRDDIVPISTWIVWSCENCPMIKTHATLPRNLHSCEKLPGAQDTCHETSHSHVDSSVSCFTKQAAIPRVYQKNTAASSLPLVKTTDRHKSD